MIFRKERPLPFLLPALLLAALVSCGIIHAADGADMTPEAFLSVVRNPPGRRSWALMTGVATHRRDNARTIKAPLRFGLLFTPERTVAQLDFNNGELYNIGQSYGTNPNTTLERAFPASRKPEIGIYGIDPRDLAMSFLHWKCAGEDAPDSISGMPCRVFRLAPPSGTPLYVRVHISSEYFFPLKVEWFAPAPAAPPPDGPYKTLEVVSFSKKGEFYHPGKLRLEGKNWKTMISFEETDADLTSKRLPPNLFRAAARTAPALSAPAEATTPEPANTSPEQARPAAPGE